jgi:hypothetical protein
VSCPPPSTPPTRRTNSLMAAICIYIQAYIHAYILISEALPGSLRTTTSIPCVYIRARPWLGSWKISSFNQKLGLRKLRVGGLEDWRTGGLERAGPEPYALRRVVCRTLQKSSPATLHSSFLHYSSFLIYKMGFDLSQNDKITERTCEIDTSYSQFTQYTSIRSRLKTGAQLHAVNSTFSLPPHYFSPLSCFCTPCFVIFLPSFNNATLRPATTSPRLFRSLGGFDTS